MYNFSEIYKTVKHNCAGCKFQPALRLIYVVYNLSIKQPLCFQRKNLGCRIFQNCVSHLVLRVNVITILILSLKTPWPESVSDLYRSSDHRLSAKLVPTSCG
jgi:hypothetical protein